MAKFPSDAPIVDVIKAFKRLGFQVMRTGNHIAMIRENNDGTSTPLTMPNHRTIAILTQSEIQRNEFLDAYYA